MAEPEFYRDLEIDTDKDIQVDAGKDLKLTTTQDSNISQSIAITANDELTDLISRPLTGKTIEGIRATILEHLPDDPQLDGIIEVEIVKVNRATNQVEARVIVDEDDDFEVTVTA